MWAMNFMLKSTIDSCMTYKQRFMKVPGMKTIQFQFPQMIGQPGAIPQGTTHIFAKMNE
jgi:hypothetical protein